ncbi:MAG: type II secretion system protein [Desulfovermiculus sp.]|nr:type II secretion system protein [Desulfovermiculus sp.]
MGKEKGFTLIEMVATLVLVGIMAVGIAYLLVPGIQGYLFAQENAQLTQKVELAMTRLTRELRECYDCNGTEGEIDLSFTFTFENTQGNRDITLSNGDLKINGYTLLDNVQSADVLTRYSTDPLSIRIKLDVAHQQGDGTLTFTTNVFPRNTYQ